MVNKTTFVILLALFLFFGGVSCGEKTNVNPNIPQVYINFTIDPNSTLFLELNSVGGWTYLEEMPGMYVPYPSRGIIVYRQDVNLFKAYERQPPNDPFRCCDDISQTCSKLVLGDNYPFVKDTCTGTMYQLLDGTIFSGEGQYSMIQYNSTYDGSLLHIYN